MTKGVGRIIRVIIAAAGCLSIRWLETASMATLLLTELRPTEKRETKKARRADAAKAV